MVSFNFELWIYFNGSIVSSAYHPSTGLSVFEYLREGSLFSLKFCMKLGLIKKKVTRPEFEKALKAWIIGD